MLEKKLRQGNKKMQSEQAIETAIINALNAKKDLFCFKFPRGQKSFSRKNTVMGSGSGVSDIIVNLHYSELCFVVYLEVKTKTGILRESQKLFKNKVESFGGLYYLVRSVEDAEDAIMDAKATLNSMIQIAKIPW